MPDVAKLEKSVAEALALALKNWPTDQPLAVVCRPGDAPLIRLLLEDHSVNVPVQADIYVAPGRFYLLDPNRFTGRAVGPVLEKQS